MERELLDEGAEDIGRQIRDNAARCKGVIKKIQN